MVGRLHSEKRATHQPSARDRSITESPKIMEVSIMTAINQTPSSAETRNCPYCKEEINLEAIRCKHCGSWLASERPSHKGTCPYCKEQIHPEAIKCKHCGSNLRAEGLLTGSCGCMSGGSTERSAAGLRTPRSRVMRYSFGGGVMPDPGGGGGGEICICTCECIPI